MKHSISVINVACLVRDFVQNEARTLEISKGKMLKDIDEEFEFKKYLKVG